MVKNLTNTEHYLWGNKCQSWKLCDDKGLSIKQELMPPNTSEEKHYHKVAKQFFYILKGVAAFEIGSKTFILHEGDGLEVQPEISHKIANTQTTELEFLVISSPGTQNDRHAVT